MTLGKIAARMEVSFDEHKTHRLTFKLDDMNKIIARGMKEAGIILREEDLSDIRYEGAIAGMYGTEYEKRYVVVHLKVKK